jgi:uncharacterized protein with PQ loop repeat
MKEKTVEKIGWLASLMAILMFSSYVDQIILNINGETGSILLPITTTVNCMVWVSYALLKAKKDWPIFTCNILGIFVGITTAVTGIIYS